MAGIYIHIPFCSKACTYCDFHFSTSLKLRSEMVEALILELEQRQAYLENESIETLYFGGGTPSVLTLKELSEIVEKVRQLNGFVAEEITIECNPEHIDEAYLIGLKKLGFNRISLGLQSFSPSVLKKMNRSHDASQSKAALSLVQKHFKNFSVDLIYGLPYTDQESDFKKDLDFLLSQQVPHISLYNLTVEEKTVLDWEVSKGIVKPVNEDQTFEEFKYLQEQLQKHGYQHYEISNACLPGNESRHNSSYWSGVKYLGIGPGAHGFNGDTRYYNVSNNPVYIRSIKEGESFSETEVLSDKDRFNESILIGLRTKKGVAIEILKKWPKLYEKWKSSPEYKNYISKELIKVDKNFLKLSPQGIFLADKISSDLFLV